MTRDRLLIIAVLSLSAGLAVIVGFCRGTAGFNAAYPFAGASLQFSISTTGAPAMLGFALTVIGIALLIWSFVDAVVRHVELRAASPRHEQAVKN